MGRQGNKRNQNFVFPFLGFVNLDKKVIKL